MADPKVEVLIDRKAGDLSIVTTADSGEDVEVTLSLEEAWALVASLNEAIQKFLPGAVQTGGNVTINARGSITSEQTLEVVHRAVQQYAPAIAKSAIQSQRKPQVRDAVLNSIGADQHRPRHLPPGPPRQIPVSGLRDSELI